MKSFRAAALLLTFSIALPASAQEVLVNGFRLVDVATTPTVRVEPLDDKAQNLDLIDGLRDRLRDAGFTVESGQPYVVGFDTRTIATLNRDRPTEGLITLEGVTGSGTGQDVRSELSIYSNRDDSLIGGRQRPRGGQDEARHELELFLSDATGKRIWQGSASTLGPEADAGYYFNALMPVLIDHIGDDRRGLKVRLTD